MTRPSMIPPQPDDHRTPAERFDSLAKRLFAVPKSQIDRQEKREAAKAKKPKEH